MKSKFKCLLCGQKTTSIIVVSPKYEYSTCGNCGLGNLNPQPTEEEMKKLYSSKNYYNKLREKVNNVLVDYLYNIKMFKSSSEWVISEFNKGNILDVGCGNGEFLYDLKKEGWNVEGSDLSRIAKERTEKIIGSKKVKLGEFPKQQFTKMYNGVTFWHVLEHVSNPQSYFQKAYNITTKGGFVAGEVPNYDSPYLMWFKQYYSWLMIPEHKIYFSKKSLQLALLKSGFNDVSVFSVRRSLLNFAFSLRNWLRANKLDDRLIYLIFTIAIPISILMGILLSSFSKGEVLRFRAFK